MLKNDLTGRRFHRFVVIKHLGKLRGHQRYLIRCDCGTEKLASYNLIITGQIKSCGCLKSELTAQKNRDRAKHNMRGTLLYHVWRGIKKRCADPKNHNYGGRGIYVCEEWKNDAAAFLKWALANGYKQGLQIDRIENNEGYSPENCRWTTPTINGNNKRTNVRYTIFGETKTATEWMRDPRNKNKSVQAFRHRLLKGVSVELALTEAPRPGVAWRL